MLVKPTAHVSCLYMCLFSWQGSWPWRAKVIPSKWNAHWPQVPIIWIFFIRSAPHETRSAGWNDTLEAVRVGRWFCSVSGWVLKSCYILENEFSLPQGWLTQSLQGGREGGWEGGVCDPMRLINMPEREREREKLWNVLHKIRHAEKWMDVTEKERTYMRKTNKWQKRKKERKKE